MKVVILAGGLGTRLREETEYRPKPMVEIGGRPILWHIMKIYASHGFNDFIVCLGYRGNMIRDYFLNYQIRNCDFTITLDTHKIDVHGNHNETGWKVTLVETGDTTNTGGRVRKVRSYLDGMPFMVTYGDGVADVREPFLDNLNQPFGMALVGTSLYVCTTDGVWRYTYQPGQTRIKVLACRVRRPAGRPCA